MPRRLLFLALIGLMLFVLAIAGDDRSHLATRLTGTSVAPYPTARAPASIARNLDIEPVETGFDSPAPSP